MKKYKVVIETATNDCGIIEKVTYFEKFRDAAAYYNAIRLDYNTNCGKYLMNINDYNIHKTSHSQLFWAILERDRDLIKLLKEKGHKDQCGYSIKKDFVKWNILDYFGTALKEGY